MTPSQTQALLQEVKDEYAKSLKAESWEDLTSRTYIQSSDVDAIAELLHTRLLAEAGRELPEEYDIANHFHLELNRSTRTELEKTIALTEWVKEKASALLAAKQVEVDRYKSLYEDYSSELDHTKEDLKKAKAEVERLIAELKVVSTDYTRLQQEGN